MSFPSEPRPAESAPTSQGSLRLLRVAGTTVFIHWSWFIAAFILLRDAGDRYSSMAWSVAEYVAGFGLVTLHEFGHVLACRSVGGTANRVVLWPLGGLAFVDAPPRPGAWLWTTVAGPLVNVGLAPVLIGLMIFTAPKDPEVPLSDVARLIQSVTIFNLIILAFNLLPIFPLDGGRILHALLWYVLGWARALLIAAGVGLVAAIGLGVLAISIGDVWLVVVCAFLAFGSVNGLMAAREANQLRPH